MILSQFMIYLKFYESLTIILLDNLNNFFIWIFMIHLKKKKKFHAGL